MAWASRAVESSNESLMKSTGVEEEFSSVNRMVVLGSVSVYHQPMVQITSLVGSMALLGSIVVTQWRQKVNVLRAMTYDSP
jgi:hypothetical protein